MPVAPVWEYRALSGVDLGLAGKLTGTDGWGLGFAARNNYGDSLGREIRMFMMDVFETIVDWSC